MFSKIIQFVFLLLICSSLSAQPKSAVPAESPELITIDSLLKAKDFETATARLNGIILKGRSSHNKPLLVKAYSRLGNILLTQRNFDQALKQYFIALDYLDTKTPPLELSRIYTNIGSLYAIIKDLPKGKAYFLKALAINTTENPDRLKTLSNLTGIYAELGEKQQALNSFTTALQLAQKLHNLPIEAILQTNLGNYFIKEKEWEKAIAACRKSLALREQLKQPLSVITLNNLGYALTHTGQVKEGIANFQAAIPAANALEKKQLYFNLYNASKSLGNLPAALKELELYNTISDSLSRLNYDQKVASLSAAYETDKKQVHINVLEKVTAFQQQQLRQQTYLAIAAALILVLTAILIFMRVKNYNVKEAFEKSQIKRQLLLLQLNPHFIFNALQSVQQFIYHRDQEHSLEYLNSFSRLIRLILENSDKDMIPLDEEIEILEHYLHLQQLGNTPNFNYQIEVAQHIETETVEIPAMLMQPFVENAVMHGVKDHPDGKILIRFEQDAGVLHVLIKDNGKGYGKISNQSGNSLHRSMGMDIMNQRIIEFNKAQNKAIQLSVTHQHTADPVYTGTVVHLQFKI
ncbi:tetratricopeptide repeat protein [Pedobacter sp. L105]|uniref:tetratricopeptide repeat-containing sensor histidine kinase n=1 Tax=Pedobacter sp. L105 TaxID=1641871 RepID=UPI00131CAA22|nr:tetratricopeptide repeat protein [Pedobacter sp. L105]